MDTPLRILHAVRSDGFAGVEQFVARLAGAQASAGHHVRVIGGDPARMRPLLEPAGVVHTATADHLWAVVAALRRHARGSDVVNSHMTAADVAAVIALARRREAPVLVSTRHFASRRGRLGPVAIDDVVDRWIAAEIAISHTVAAAIAQPSTVIHPGVETRSRVAAGSRVRSVLVAQRLQPEKLTEVAIAAFAASGLARDGWRLLIAGEGTERQRLVDLARTNGIAPWVDFLGFRRDTAQLMDAAGLLLATAQFEHFGLSVLEAMAAGLPVVASDAGGHRELLGGLDERALFAVGDVEGAARSLRALAEDPSGRDELGRAERDRQLESFTLSQQAVDTEALYRLVIAQRSVPR